MTATTYNRPWLDAEVDYLRRNYLRLPTAEVASRLGRTATAVNQAARRFGASRACPRKTPELAAEVRRLHSQGKSDGAIARALGLRRPFLGRFRRELGLPANRARGCLAGSEEIRETTRLLDARAKQMGFRNWGHYILTRRRLRCMASFPGCTTAGQVRLCRRLCEGGPLTWAQATAEATKGRRMTLVRAAGELVALGYVLDEGGLLRLAAGARPDEEDRP